MRTVIGLALATAAAAASMERPMYEGYTYEQFIQDFDRPALLSATNGVEQLLGRKAIFELNLEKIRRHNANPNKTWYMAVNQFADHTEDEINAKFTGKKRANGMKNPLSDRYVGGNRQFLKTRAMGDYPKDVNWVARGAVPYTANQGQCGSCWAFGTVHQLVGAASIVHKQQTGQYLDSSFKPAQQQLVDCAPNPNHCGGTGGCSGSTQELGYDYVHNIGGLVDASVYPYTATTNTCKADLVKKAPKVVSVDGYKVLPTNDVDALMTAIQEAPVSISVAASKWAFYGGGIFNECHTGEDGKKQDNVIDHAVTLVGYGADENGSNYWLVQNSWGSWGTNACDDASNPACKAKGFIKVKRAADGQAEKCGVDNEPADGSACDGETDPVTVCGECGIISDSSMATGVHVNSTAIGMF